MRQSFSFVAIVFVLLLSGNVYAGAGQAYIPHWFDANWQASLFCSNITDNDILVTIKLFYQDGTLMQESSSSPSSGKIQISYADAYYDYQEYTPGAEAKTVSFWLKPHNSVCMAICYSSSSTSWGYGTIEWSNSANEYKGMVANIRTYAATNMNTIYGITINGGNPF